MNPENAHVVAEHASQTYRQGQLFVTLAFRWKRPSGEWSRIAFDKIVLPDARATVVMSKVAFPLDTLLQAGGDATEEDMKKAFEAALG